MRSCSAYVTDVMIVRMSMPYEKKLNFVFLSMLRNLTMVNSGASGYVINTFYGLLPMKEFHLDNLYTEVGLYIAALGSSVLLQNGGIVHGSAQYSTEQTENWTNTIYFGGFVSQVVLQRMTVSDSSLRMGSITAFDFSISPSSDSSSVKSAKSWSEVDERTGGIRQHLVSGQCSGT